MLVSSEIGEPNRSIMTDFFSFKDGIQRVVVVEKKGLVRRKTGLGRMT